MIDQDSVRRNGRRYAPPKAAAAYIGVTTMSLWRWNHSSALNFPKPAVINEIPYFDLDAIDEWMRSRVTAKIKAASEQQSLPPAAPEQETKPRRTQEREMSTRRRRTA